MLSEAPPAAIPIHSCRPSCRPSSFPASSTPFRRPPCGGRRRLVPRSPGADRWPRLPRAIRPWRSIAGPGPTLLPTSSRLICLMMAESQSLAFLLTWATTSRAVRWIQSRSWAAQTSPSSGSLVVSNVDGPEQGLLGRGGDDALARLGVERLEGLVDLVDVLGIGLRCSRRWRADGALGDLLGPLAAPLAESLLDRLGPGEQGRLPAVELLPGRVDVLGEDLRSSPRRWACTARWGCPATVLLHVLVAAEVMVVGLF